MLRRVSSWMDEHAAVSPVLDFVRQQVSKSVPRKLSWLYTAGTLAAFFFGLQFLTGLLLLMVYIPDEGLAFSSVQTIEHRVELGWLVRQMHAWGASFIVIVLIVHTLKVLWYGSYKCPREFTWMVGFILLSLTLAFCLSGYLLPWNQLGFWATRVAVGAIDSVPVIGKYLTAWICGGPDVSGATLGRFFSLHVMLFPLLSVVVMAAHLALVIKLGITPKTTVKEENELGHQGALDLHGSEPFFPRQAYREVLVLNIGFALLVTFSAFFPWELGEPATHETPEGIKPEWYFLPFYQFLKYFDDSLYRSFPFLKSLGLSSEFLGVLCINFVGLLVFLLPVLDRGKERRMAKRPFFAFFACLLIAVTLLLGCLGYVAGNTVTFAGRTYQFTSKGYPMLVERKSEPAAEPVSETQEAEAAPAAEVVAPTFREDGLAPSGTCGGCHNHEEQLEEWQGSIHRHNEIQCGNCHGGIDTASPASLPEGVTPEIYAHLGIKERGRGEPVAPSKKEIPEFCGKCHQNVLSVFSPLHLKEPPEGQRIRSCVTCHSNHAVDAAGNDTYESRGAYKKDDADDPRAAPFWFAHGAFEDLAAIIVGAGQQLEKLEKTGYPTEAFKEEIEQSREMLALSRYLVHSLDVERISKAAKEVRESIEPVVAEIEVQLKSPDDRWKLVVGVWAVALFLNFLIVLKLRALPAAPSPGVEDDVGPV